MEPPIMMAIDRDKGVCLPTVTQNSWRGSLSHSVDLSLCNLRGHCMATRSAAYDVVQCVRQRHLEHFGYMEVPVTQRAYRVTEHCIARILVRNVKFLLQHSVDYSMQDRSIQRCLGLDVLDSWKV